MPAYSEHSDSQAQLAELVTIRRVLQQGVGALLSNLNEGFLAIMALLDTLQATVTRTEGVADSAVALLDGLKAQLDAVLAAGAPPAVVAALQALSDELGAKTDQLAAAVANDTPVPPPA